MVNCQYRCFALRTANIELMQYNRMIYLNFHIKEQFKKQASEIKQSTLDKNGKISTKDFK